MESEVLKIASTQGVWAVLCITLIFYILKAQEKRDLKQEDREKRYQEIIEILSDKLNLIDDIKKDILEIKESVLKK